MERVGVRELRQHASRYLDLVKAGQSIEVTERGQLIALLVPPAPGQSARDRLVESGRLLPAQKPLRLPRRIRVEGNSGDVLDELRDER